MNEPDYDYVYNQPRKVKNNVSFREEVADWAQQFLVNDDLIFKNERSWEWKQFLMEQNLYGFFKFLLLFFLTHPPCHHETGKLIRKRNIYKYKEKCID